MNLKRLKPYQPRLELLLGNDEHRTIPVSFEVKETSSGKYKGQPHVVVTTPAGEVGEWPAQYRDENAGLFDAIVNQLVVSGDAQLRPSGFGGVYVVLKVDMP